MTSSRVVETFKLFGKLVKLSELGAAYASGVKEHALAVQGQFAAAAPGPHLYDDFTLSLLPLQQRISAVAGTLDRVPAMAKAAADTYLRALAPELSQPASASSAAVLSALASAMTAASGTIAPSGTFYSFFQSGWGFTGFPTSEEPTVPDALITTTIV